MSLSTYTTTTGYLLDSIHSWPPFFTQQPNPETQSDIAGYWTRIILGYGRHRGLFFLRLEDAETTGGDWDEVLRNPRINRRLLPSHLSAIFAHMVSQNVAVYEPPKQTSSLLLFWRLPEEWAEVLHGWATSTGQLNTILTFYEITEPSTPSPLSGIPLTLLRKAITVLTKTSRAQIIGIAEGEGVRLLPGNREMR